MKNIILNEFRGYIRNPFIVVVMIFFPIVMIYILGNLVEKVQVSDETIGTVQVAYTAEQMDLGAIASNDLLTFIEMSKEDGLKALQEEEVNGYLAMKDSNITIYEGSSVLTNNVLRAISNGILLNKSVYETIAVQNPGSMNLITVRDQDYTTKRDLNTNMTMFDYYVIAMTVMTGLYSCLVSSMTFTEERKNRTMSRLITSPMNKGKIFLAKCLGQIPFAILQIGILLVFSAVFFHAQYASAFGGKMLLFLMLIMTAIVSNIVGVVVSLVFKRSMAVPIFILVWLILLWSGCFAKAMTLDPLCNFLPAYIVKQAAIDLNLFGNTAPAWNVILVELAMAAGLILIGGLVFSRKREERA